MPESPANTIDTLHRLTFPLFEGPELFHGVFARPGGVSPAPFHSLNVGLHVGDTSDNVRINRELIKKNLNTKILVSMHQVHETRIVPICSMPESDREIADCDGLITNLAGIALMVQQADCQAVLFHDPVTRAVGIVHAGWRGSAANIISCCISAMAEKYTCRAENLQVAISPSLGPCCAEFTNFKKELPQSLHPFQVRPDYFDFWAISRHQLTSAGVLEKNITTAGVCTVCSEEYFSYRRERTTGRFASLIGIH